MYYLFAFRSRTNALKFSQSLKGEGAMGEAVSTPHTLGVGCGLSVKTNNLQVAKRLLSYGKYATYIGCFEIKDYNGKMNIIKKE